jgi:penicillin-binding protein 2
MSERHKIRDHGLERRIFLTRLKLGGFFIILLMGIIVLRLMYLQVSQHDYYSTKSDSYRISVQPVPPTRGRIYDRNGLLLADNRPNYTLTVVRENARDFDKSLKLLSELVVLSEEDVDELKGVMRQNRVPFSAIPVRYGLTEEEVATISVNLFRLPGMRVTAQLERFYPQGEAVAHVVGYVGRIAEGDLVGLDEVNYRGTERIGKAGVEKFYEDVLHGKVGYETVEKNARGQILQVLERIDPIPGQDIVLNIDWQLQQAANKALGDYRGAVVAIDTKTGGVLAMVSKPSFDPNLFVNGISRKDYAALQDPVATPLYNRAIARYSPGSTLKPFIGLAALELGIRTREHSIADPGFYRLSGDSHVYHDWTWWTNKSGHGTVDLAKAIYQSCDTYFFDLATDMDIDQMHDFLRHVGFGRNTAADIPQATAGLLPSRQWKKQELGKPWYSGETLNSSIGQGYTMASPLQLATATSVLANKGKWHTPSLLKRIGRENEDIIFASTMPDLILKNHDDWDFIGEAMVGVVHRQGGYRDSGTAYPYIAMNNPPPYIMAGKSGTAQVVGMPADFDKQNTELPEKYRDHALFISYAPANAPEIALAVFVEHGVGGSGVAGPIARQILDAWLLRESPQLVANER